MSRFIFALGLVATSLLAFAGTAVASNVVAPDDGSLLDLAKPALSALTHGQWLLAAALVLVFGVALARRYGTKRFPFLATDTGGAALTLAGAFGGALATALAAGSLPSLALAYTAGKIAVIAAGGYTLIKRLVINPLRPQLAKLPAWCQPIIALMLWVFDRPTAVAKAETAGDDAVKASPAQGVDGITGDRRDIE